MKLNEYPSGATLDPDTAAKAMQYRVEQARKTAEENTTSKIHALGSQVVVLPGEKGTLTKNGLHVPESSSPLEQRFGTVVSIGPDVDLAKCPIEVGMEVVVGRFVESQPDAGGLTFLLVPWQGVLGRIERRVAE